MPVLTPALFSVITVGVAQNLYNTMEEELRSALNTAGAVRVHPETQATTTPRLETVTPLPDLTHTSAIAALTRAIGQMEKHEDRGSFTTMLGLDPTLHPSHPDCASIRPFLSTQAQCLKICSLTLMSTYEGTY